MRPSPLKLDELAVQSFDDEALKAIFVEFEFNALGRRLFGDDFKAGAARTSVRRSRRSRGQGARPKQGDLGIAGRSLGEVSSSGRPVCRSVAC